LLAGIRSRLSYANVMATIAVFIALGGVTWAAATINGRDVINNSLTGKDIKDHSRVDTCPDGSKRFGDNFCVRFSNLSLSWPNAGLFCGDLEMRLPSRSEAVALATNYEITANNELFWTDEYWTEFDSGLQFEAGKAMAVFGNGQTSSQATGTTIPTVCITTPTN
jgi:hypothetical protein